jgi:tensin
MLNLMTQKEQEELKDEAWFQAGMSRQISLEILLQLQPGSFLVRQSETAKNCYALSMRIPASYDMPKLAHYLIEKSRNGYRFKGFTKEFPSIKSLVVHHSIIKGHLAVPLNLTRPQDFAIQNIVYDEGQAESESDVEESAKTTSCFCKN